MTWETIVDLQNYRVKLLKLKRGEKYVIPPEQRVAERLYLSKGEISYGSRVLREGAGDLGKLALSAEASIEVLSKEAHLVEFTSGH